MNAESSRSIWGSRIGFILASAGSAVGLGAIWKFPYMAGTNGGSAFIIPYIVLSVAVGFIVLLIEMAIGRAGRGGPARALARLGGKGWRYIGMTSVLTGFLIMAFYQVIGGWCLHYMVEAIMGRGLITDRAALGASFGAFVENGPQIIAMQLGFLALSLGVIAMGVQSGIERISKVLMPLLFLMMLFLIGRALTLPGAWAGVEFMFQFDAQSFTGASLLNALGFAFFSLSLGSGSMMNYGSYLSERVNLTTSVAWISFLAMMAAILAGLMIMPAVFAFGLDPAAGPGLTFVTMPAVFAQLPFGQLFAVVFYVCLVVAALTSAISMIEMSVQFLVDEFNAKRSIAIALVGTVLAAIGMLCSLSFGALADYKLFNRTIFDFLDYFTSNIGLPVGAMAIAVVGGFIAWPVIRNQLTLTKSLPKMLIAAIQFSIRFITPCVIIVIALAGLIG